MKVILKNTKLIFETKKEPVLLRDADIQVRGYFETENTTSAFSGAITKSGTYKVVCSVIDGKPYSTYTNFRMMVNGTLTYAVTGIRFTSANKSFENVIEISEIPTEYRIDGNGTINDSGEYPVWMNVKIYEM